MNIQIIRDKTPDLDKITGGGYALTEVKIHVASNMPKETQQEVVIHEILEAYLRILDHSKIDTLTQLIVEGLMKL